HRLTLLYTDTNHHNEVTNIYGVDANLRLAGNALLSRDDPLDALDRYFSVIGQRPRKLEFHPLSAVSRRHFNDLAPQFAVWKYDAHVVVVVNLAIEKVNLPDCATD